MQTNKIETLQKYNHRIIIGFLHTYNICPKYETIVVIFSGTKWSYLKRLVSFDIIRIKEFDNYFVSTFVFCSDLINVLRFRF